MRRCLACFGTNAARHDDDGRDALIGNDSTSALQMRGDVALHAEVASGSSSRTSAVSAARAFEDTVNTSANATRSAESGDMPSPSSMTCCISMCLARYPIVVNGVVFDAVVLASYIQRTFDTKNPVTRTPLSMRDVVDVDALSDSGGAVFDVFCNPSLRRDHIAHESTVAYLEREIRLLDSEHRAKDIVVTALSELRGFDVSSYNALLPSLSKRVRNLCANPRAFAD